MKIEFDADNTILGKTLYVLAKCEENPEFRITFTVKNKESVKDVLLTNAVKDAKSKAGVLAEAAGVNLNEIISIDYSWNSINFEYTPTNNFVLHEMYEYKSDRIDVNIEADDIIVSDDVTVIWQIGSC